MATPVYAWRAITSISYMNRPAYSAGDIVPDANVALYGYDAKGLVERVTITDTLPRADGVDLVTQAELAASVGGLVGDAVDSAVDSAVGPAVTSGIAALKGANGGLAALGPDGKVASPLPDLSSVYLPISKVGAPNGAAAVGSDGKVSSPLPDLSGTYAAAGRVASLETVVGANLIGSLFANAATTPINWAHRAGAHVFPEQTFEASAGSLAIGGSAVVLDYDANLLADGAVGMCHDHTVDRTTTATGPTSAFTTQQWLNLQSDAGAWFAPAWRNDLRIPLTGEILDRFGGKCGLSIEAKTTSVLQPLIREISRRGMQKSCLINTQIITDIAAIKAAGIHACYYFPDANPAQATMDAVRAAAPNSIVVQRSTALVTLQAVIAWGIPVLAGETDRRSEWKVYRDAGAVGVVTNEPAYTLGTVAPRTTDTWATKTYGHGFISNNTYRPTFSGTNAIRWGADKYPLTTLIGEVSPTAGPNRTIDLWVAMPTPPTDLTRYFQITLADTDVEYNYTGTPFNGYSLNYRADGSLYVYAVTKGGASTMVSSKTNTAPAAGERRHLQVAITSTGLNFTDVTTGTSVTTADATQRPAGGWFLTLGKSDLANGNGVWEADSLSIT